jgi:uncharacterized protein YjbI with pentapeptide repeats
MRGVKLGGAQLQESDLEGADLRDAEGVDEAQGLDQAKNRERARWN